MHRPTVRYTGEFETFDSDEIAALARHAHNEQDATLWCRRRHTGGHLDAWALRRRYTATLNRAGLRRITFHSLRHAFGTTAVRALPLSDVQAMLGHAHVTTTMRYVHHRPGADDAARLSSAFRGDAVSPLVSRTSGNGRNSAQLNDAESAA